MFYDIKKRGECMSKTRSKMDQNFPGGEIVPHPAGLLAESHMEIEIEGLTERQKLLARLLLKGLHGSLKLLFLSFRALSELKEKSRNS